MGNSPLAGAYPANRPRGTVNVPKEPPALIRDYDSLVDKAWANKSAGRTRQTIGPAREGHSMAPLFSQPGPKRFAGKDAPRIVGGITEAAVMAVAPGEAVARTSVRVDPRVGNAGPFFDEHAFLTAMAVWPWAHEGAWLAAGVICGCGGAVRLESEWDSGYLQLGTGESQFVVCAVSGYLCAPAPDGMIRATDLVPRAEAPLKNFRHYHVLEVVRPSARDLEPLDAAVQAHNLHAKRGRLCVTPELTRLVAANNPMVVVDPHADDLYGERTAEQALEEDEEQVYDVSTCRVYATRRRQPATRLYMQTRWPETERVVAVASERLPEAGQDVISLAHFWAVAASAYAEGAIDDEAVLAQCLAVALGGIDDNACYSLLLGALQSEQPPSVLGPVPEQVTKNYNVVYTFDEGRYAAGRSGIPELQKELERVASLGVGGEWSEGPPGNLARDWTREHVERVRAPPDCEGVKDLPVEVPVLRTPAGCCQQVVWMAWTGDNALPNHLAANIESFRRNSGVSVCVVTPANVCAFVPWIPPQYSKLILAHRADVLRCLLLAEHGGWWADIDVMCMGPITGTLPFLRTAGFVSEPITNGWSDSDTCNDFIGPVVANCPAVREWASSLWHKLDERDDAGEYRSDYDWEEILRGVLTPALGVARDDVIKELRTHSLVPEHTWLRTGTCEDIVAAIREGVTVLKTNNAYYGRVLREFSLGTIVGSNTEYGELLRACFGSPPEAWTSNEWRVDARWTETTCVPFLPPTPRPEPWLDPSEDDPVEWECRKLVVSTLRRWHWWMSEDTAWEIVLRASAPLRYARRVWFTCDKGPPSMVIELFPPTNEPPEWPGQYDLTVHGW